MEERRERVLTPSVGAAAYRGRRHAGSRWRGTVVQCHGDSGKREQRACILKPLLHAPSAINAALAEFPYTLGPWLQKMVSVRRNSVLGIPYCIKYEKVTSYRFQ